MSEDLPTRLRRFLTEHDTERVVEVLEVMARQTCKDRDCVTLRKHGLLGPHLWRHEASAPYDRGWLGWHCWSCCRPTWHRIHRVKRGLL